MTGTTRTNGRVVRKAVITCAGRGTRQYPASSAVQKEMFPLVDTDGLTKTVIQIIGEEAVRAGCEEICLVVQPGDERVYADYFRGMTEETFAAFAGKDWAVRAAEQLSDFGQRLHFVSQGSPEGYGHAVYQAKNFVGDEPFLHLLGDHVYISAAERGCAEQLIERYQSGSFAALSAVQETPERLLHLFGTMRGEAPGADLESEGDCWRVAAIEEKPSVERARSALRTPGVGNGMYLCHFGMHVFPPAIFEALGHHIDHDIRVGGEIQLTNAQEFMRAELLGATSGARDEGCGYGACRISGRRFDTGIPYGLMETQLALALAGRHRGEIVESLALMLAEHLAPVAMKHG